MKNSNELNAILCSIFLPQMTSSIQIITAFRIAGHELALVGVFIAGKAACNRPEAAGIELLKQRRVGHQPHDAAIVVRERVYPCQPVMCGRDGEDRFRLAETTVGLLEAFKETGQGTRTDRDVSSDLDIMLAQLAR